MLKYSGNPGRSSGLFILYDIIVSPSLMPLTIYGQASRLIATNVPMLSTCCSERIFCCESLKYFSASRIHLMKARSERTQETGRLKEISPKKRFIGVANSSNFYSELVERGLVWGILPSSMPHQDLHCNARKNVSGFKRGRQGLYQPREGEA
jgi:hypothetical protein